jgi:flavin-binding protein dodecin
MTVARVTELSATSDESFEDAINQAVNRATQLCATSRVPGSRTRTS